MLAAVAAALLKVAAAEKVTVLAVAAAERGRGSELGLLERRWQLPLALFFPSLYSS